RGAAPAPRVARRAGPPLPHSSVLCARAHHRLQGTLPGRRLPRRRRSVRAVGLRRHGTRARPCARTPGQAADSRRRGACGPPRERDPGRARGAARGAERSVPGTSRRLGGGRGGTRGDPRLPRRPRVGRDAGLRLRRLSASAAPLSHARREAARDLTTGPRGGRSFPRRPVRSYEGRMESATRDDILEGLNVFRALESWGAALYAAWAGNEPDPLLRAGHLIIAEREANHARLLAERLRALGAAPGPACVDQVLAEQLAELRDVRGFVAQLDALKAVNQRDRDRMAGCQAALTRGFAAA